MGVYQVYKVLRDFLDASVLCVWVLFLISLMNLN